MNLNLNISHDTLQSFGIIKTQEDKYLLNKTNFGKEGLTIDKSQIKIFINKLKKEYILKEFIYDLDHTKVYILENDNLTIEIKENIDYSTVSFYTKTREEELKIFKIYKEFEIKDENVIYFDTFVKSFTGLRTKSKIIKKENFENITDDYYPFLYVDDFISQYLKLKENVLILSGEPGTGKSKFVSYIFKYLLNNKNKSYKVASVKDIEVISTDDFWNEVELYDFIVFDDLDFMLSDRNETREDITKNNFITKLLSFSDGVIENRTKIIITSNQPINEIDPALLREGRIFDVLKFRKLKKEEAEKILKKYNIEYEIKDKYISQAKLSSIINSFNQNLNFEKSYLKEKNISILYSPKKRKTGFV